MTTCRGCAEPDLKRVLDLGRVPAADYFPLATEPVRAEETSHSLAMDVCSACGLAQLADDDTVADEPRGVEPQALKDQAEEAIRGIAAAGWLRGNTVLEFGSPHGGTWIPLLTERGFTTSSSSADTVLDCFGIMHEPDQRAAFAERAQVTRDRGVLLLQYHSIVTIVEQGQWNALRHGHFAYYSLTTLTRLLGAVGMSVVSAWEFDLYGGTVLLAAVHGNSEPDESVLRHPRGRRGAGDHQPVSSSAASNSGPISMRNRYEAGSKRRRRPAAACSPTAPHREPLPSSAGLGSIPDCYRRSPTPHLPNKEGGCRGPTFPSCLRTICSTAKPDRVLLTVPDLLPEVSARFPELDGRWKVDGQ